MIFEKYLLPDRLFASFRDVTPEVLSSLGVRALLCDIDNTLVTYDDAEPTPDVLGWLASLSAAGISVAFVSNNDEARVSRFNRELSLAARHKAGKPAIGAYEDVLAELGVDRSQSAVLGDQLLTDAWAAHRLGVAALIVPPIRDKRTLFFRFKRALEAPYMRKARKLGR